MTEHSAEWQIGTVDLRRGLAAVMPHVNPDHEQPSTHRVRIEIGSELLMIATDGLTAGIYASDATHIRTFGMDWVDLSPADVGKILAVFKAGKDEDADYPESVLEFSVTEKVVTIRDVSGMFAGHELELPATPPGEFPNVAGILAGRLSPAGRSWVRPSGHNARVVQVGHKMMTRFTASGKAIGSPLTIDTDATPFVVTAGEVFVGLIMPLRMGENDLDRLVDLQDRWRTSAEQLAAAVAARTADLAAVSELMAAAVRAVGVRQSATVVGLAEALSVDRATATDLLTQMYAAGLVGPPKRGKGREVMFSPDEVERALATLAGDDQVNDDEPAESVRAAFDAGEKGVTAPPPPRFDPDMPDADPADRHEPPDSPFSDPPVPPSPFVDSDGNAWPTSPFDKPAAPDDPPF